MGPVAESVRKRIGFLLRKLGLGQVTAFRFWLRYLRDRRSWIKKGGKVHRRYRILADYSDSAGVASGHYFHQDLLVAGFVM